MVKMNEGNNLWLINKLLLPCFDVLYQG